MMSAAAVFNEDFKIPNSLVGLVIGRGGEQIKKLQSESQCKIRIASEGDGTPQRSCTLTGSQEQIDMAKQLLEGVVRRGQNREQGEGGAPRQGGYQRREGGYGGQQGGYGGQQGGYQQGGYQQGGYGGQQGGAYGAQQGYGAPQGGYRN